MPWTRVVDAIKLKQTLSAFLKDVVYQVDITGDMGPANALIAELKATMDRKRDNKWLIKQCQVADKREDKQKAQAILWADVEERYLNTLIRAPVSPVTWVNDEYPKTDADNAIVRKLLIKGKLKPMKEYHQHALALEAVEPVFEEIGETLEKYIASHGIIQTDMECLRLVVDAGHGKIVRELTRLMFGARTKVRTLWISGVANSGKSMLIRRLRSIFASDEVDWRGVYMPVRERNMPDIKSQLLTCEEFNFKEAFADGNLAVTKLLMEGEGANVRKDLFAQFQSCYKDVIVVVGSNKLPATEVSTKIPHSI